MAAHLGYMHRQRPTLAGFPGFRRLENQSAPSEFTSKWPDLTALGQDARFLLGTPNLDNVCSALAGQADLACGLGWRRAWTNWGCLVGKLFAMDLFLPTANPTYAVRNGWGRVLVRRGREHYAVRRGREH